MSASNGNPELAHLKERLANTERNLVVAAGLTERLGTNVKSHAGLFVEVDKRLAEFAAADKILEKRISALVSTIGGFLANQKQ